MKTTLLFKHSSRKILATALLFLSGALTDFAETTEVWRPQRSKAPKGTCNLPPVPAPGQTVTWTLAGSPYEICQNITIPPTSTVIVEAGVLITFDADMQVLVSGTMQLQGEAAQRVVLQAPAVFPPIIDINGGVFDASFSDFTGQVRIENGANVVLLDSKFQTGNGVLWAQELPTTRPFIRVERCAFDAASSAVISDALTVFKDNAFNSATCSFLRGFADVTSTNTFTSGGFSVTREESVQPFYINGVHATNSTTAGLVLSGGNYSVGVDTLLQNNPYPVVLEGGLLPDSAIPSTGNTINAINVGNGGFAGRGRWSQIALPYRLTLPTTDLPGGDLTVDPGVIVEATDPDAGLRFRSTRHSVLKGRPDTPIIFRGLNGQPWDGLLFATNATTGCRLEYCMVANASFGVVSTDNWLYVDSCEFTNNNVGANMNTFGAISFAKTRFITNSSGVSFDVQGSPFLNSLSTPNSFEGNGAGIDAFSAGSSADARNCWWNDPGGPTTPRNPGGQGDSIVGAGEPGVQFSPFLTSAPDFDTPPVVRMLGPGLTQLYASPDLQIPDFLLDQGTKYIVHWTAQDDHNIASQRIDFSPDGHYPDRYTTLVTDIPASARSWEITIPNPGFAASNQPQFFRVVSTDGNGQEGWDEAPVLVPSGNITGELTITTDLSGQTFTAGEPIPDLDWTGSVNFGTITPVVVLESDGAGIAGLNIGGHGVFFQNFPFVSTDRARLALQVRNNSNDSKWFFASGYFSIRHDSRLAFEAPTVNLEFPLGGESFPGGSTVTISWKASASEGLRSFAIQGSYDSGRTWHLIAHDLASTEISYDWQLPPSSGIGDVRVRVIARDVRFQNSSSTSGSFSITPSGPTPTPTPTATATPTPSATATATPTSTPRPTPTPRTRPSPRTRPTPHPRPSP